LRTVGNDWGRALMYCTGPRNKKGWESLLYNQRQNTEVSGSNQLKLESNRPATCQKVVYFCDAFRNI